jgi:hypothetical protein
MVYKERIKVTEIKADVPVVGLEYVQVSLGMEVDLQQNVKTGMINGKIFKHILHVFIPKSEWKDQYKMWEEFDASVDDKGNVSLKRVKAGDNNDQ